MFMICSLSLIEFEGTKVAISGRDAMLDFSPKLFALWNPRYVLHDARTSAFDWEGKGAADILRADADPRRLKRIEQEVTEETEIFSVFVLSVCSCLSLGFIGWLPAESGDALRQSVSSPGS